MQNNSFQSSKQRAHSERQPFSEPEPVLLHLAKAGAHTLVHKTIYIPIRQSIHGQSCAGRRDASLTCKQQKPKLDAVGDTVVLGVGAKGSDPFERGSFNNLTDSKAESYDSPWVISHGSWVSDEWDTLATGVQSERNWLMKLPRIPVFINQFDYRLALSFIRVMWRKIFV